jgi:hypothetical protein
MRKLTPEDLLDLASYDAARAGLRERIIAHKKRRRVLLGPEISMVFEDRDTVRHQVQEMLRAERITDPAAVRFEVETYNDLIPPDGALLATLMIEVEDAAVRETRRRDLHGIDEAIALEIGGERFPATLDAAGRYEDRVAVVRYATFALPPNGRALLLDLATPARIVCSHPRYGYSAALSDDTRRALAEDL